MSLLELLGEAIAELAALAEEPDLTPNQRADVAKAIAHLERCLDRI